MTEEKDKWAHIPKWLNQAVIVALIGLMGLVAQDYIRKTLQLSEMQLRIVGLEQRINSVEGNLIGIKRFEDFERMNDQQLEEIKQLLQQHERSTRNRSVIWGGSIKKAPKVENKHGHS